jgi:hypothetical protein
VPGSISSTKKENQMSADLSQEIDAVERATEVIQSATVLINGIGARIVAAVAVAMANGATEAELQPLTDLSVELAARSVELADAVAANTPAE